MIPGVLGEAAPGFDQPLDVLEACHQRIARQCDTLEKLLVHHAVHGSDTQARQAARAILIYFDTAAVQHHDDEERNLFPLLEQTGPPGACDLVGLLTHEHDELALLWRALRPTLTQIASNHPVRLDESNARRFITLNRSHLDFENTHVLPLARRILGASALQRLGSAMAARRGVSFSALA
jgi:hemerythrin-like domain-containing protein